MQFEKALKRTLLDALDNNYTDNYDYYMHGEEDPSKWPQAWYREFNWKVPFVSKRKYVKKLMKRQATKCQFLYDRLQSPKEKELLLKLVAFRQLGLRRVKLPDSQDYFETVGQLMAEFDELRGEKLGGDFMFDLYLTDFSSYGFPVKIYAGALTLYYEVLKDQYQYSEVGFKVEKGDILIDAGACVGDSTFFFASRVGSSGKVFAFEMLPANLRVLYKNVSLNAEEFQNIKVFECPLAEESDKEFYIVENGPASCISEKAPKDTSQAVVVKSMSIDSLVKEEKLDKVDMIKMDIEGAELSALKGAVDTIKSFRPKLAICVYHRECDFDEIPRYIDSLGMDYKFHLKHHGIQQGETVLYCL